MSSRENFRGSESLPAQIGRYRLIGRLAKGGMAEAYLAMSGDLPGLRTVVVVKRILPHLCANEQYVRMFFDEARIGALLDHPNIPRIIEVGYDDNGYFLAMEAVAGKPLSAILRRARRRKRPLDQACAAFIVGRAAAGLGYAHGLTDPDGRPLNIVHRDVSPENILVSFEGAVKLIDFGIASAHGRVTETFVGGLKGKVEYMSPEQVAGAPVDRRSDVFSLGVVLWEALSGQRLFRRDTDLAAMRAITGDPIPRPSGLLPVDPGLERIVMTALERAPEDRFQDAHEMALLLERHAFRTDGFDPSDLVARVKQLFPEDYAGWKATVGMAQGIEGACQPKMTGTFPSVGGMPTPSLTNKPTPALHDRQRAAEAVTRAEPVRSLRAEAASVRPPGGGPSLPRLASWAGAQPEPVSDSGESSPGVGEDVRAHRGRRFTIRNGVPGPVWLVAGAIVSATICAWLRPTTAVPSAAALMVQSHATSPAEAPPVPKPLDSVASEPPSIAPPASGPFGPSAEPPAPAALSALERPGAVSSSPPKLEPPSPPRGPARPLALRHSLPVPARAVPPVRKRAAAHRPPAAAPKQLARQAPRPAAPPLASPPAPTSAPAPASPPPARRVWKDPFQ